MKVYDGTDESATTETAERIKVGIAEYQVTTDGAALTTSGLGSCLGVALYDPEAGVAGLIHVMLPTADEVDDENPAKFADTGIEHLVEDLNGAGATVDRLEAKVAGGSDMLDFSENGSGIGVRNVEQVEQTLGEFDIPVVDRDVGGDHGRSLRFDTTSYDLLVKSANQGEQTL